MSHGGIVPTVTLWSHVSNEGHGPTQHTFIYSGRLGIIATVVALTGFYLRLSSFSCGAFTFVAVVLFYTLGEIRQCSSKVGSSFSLISRESARDPCSLFVLPQFSSAPHLPACMHSGPPRRMSSHARVASIFHKHHIYDGSSAEEPAEKHLFWQSAEVKLLSNLWPWLQEMMSGGGVGKETLQRTGRVHVQTVQFATKNSQ